MKNETLLHPHDGQLFTDTRTYLRAKVVFFCHFRFSRVIFRVGVRTEYKHSSKKRLHEITSHSFAEQLKQTINLCSSTSRIGCARQIVIFAIFVQSGNTQDFAHLRSGGFSGKVCLSFLNLTAKCFD